MAINDVSSYLGLSIIFICPSKNKECGIARYTDYAAKDCEGLFKSVSILATSDEAYNICAASSDSFVVIFQHEYGLLDFRTPLSGPESTANVIQNLTSIQKLRANCFVAVVMHTVVPFDDVCDTINRQLFSSSLPIFTLSRDGAARCRINFIEHGVVSGQKIKKRGREFSIGAFGFLTQNKDIESIFKVCIETNSPIRANFASKKGADIAFVIDRAKQMGVTGNLSFDFLDESQLAEFLQDSSVIYMPQHDFEHFATSGSVRFALSIDRPIIVTPHRPFHDVSSAVLFADIETAIEEIRKLKRLPARSDLYDFCARKFQEIASLTSVYETLIDLLLNNNAIIGGASAKFDSLLEVSESEFVSYVLPKAELLPPQALKSISRNGSGFVGGNFVSISPNPTLGRSRNPEEGGLIAEILHNARLLDVDTNDFINASDDVEMYVDQGSSLSLNQDNFLLHHDRQYESFITPSLKIKLPDVSVKAKLMSSIVHVEQNTFIDDLLYINDCFLDSLRDGNAINFVNSKLTNARASMAYLRAFRPAYGYALPVIEFLDFLPYIKALVLTQDFDFNVENVIQYILSDNNLQKSTEDRISILSKRLILFRNFAGSCNSLALQWIWGGACMIYKHEYRQVILPTSIVGLDDKYFVLSLYWSILRRDPDFDGFSSNVRALREGHSKFDMANAFAESQEGRNVGVIIFDSLSNWNYSELNINSDAALCAALAPPEEYFRYLNIKRKDEIYSDRVIDNLKSQMGP